MWSIEINGGIQSICTDRTVLTCIVLNKVERVFKQVASFSCGLDLANRKAENLNDRVHFIPRKMDNFAIILSFDMHEFIPMEHIFSVSTGVYNLLQIQLDVRD
jgi:hypothetical protein